MCFDDGPASPRVAVHVLLRCRSGKADHQGVAGGNVARLKTKTRAFVPELSPRNVVIVNTLSSHKAPTVLAAIEASGARLLFHRLTAPTQTPSKGVIESEGASAERVIDAGYQRRVAWRKYWVCS
jgi:hypothetical protein